MTFLYLALGYLVITVAAFGVAEALWHEEFEKECTPVIPAILFWPVSLPIYIVVQLFKYLVFKPFYYLALGLKSMRRSK
jgi:predicted outer membrane lipoprotein